MTVVLAFVMAYKKSKTRHSEVTPKNLNEMMEIIIEFSGLQLLLKYIPLLEYIHISQLE